MFASGIQQLFGKFVSEHEKAALRGLTRGFVLEDIPMFNKNTVFDAQNVRGNPVHRIAAALKSAVHDDKIFIRHNRSGFVLQRRRNAFDEIEEAVPARRDMSAVLNIGRRPETFSGRIVPLVEQGVERFKHQCFVFRCNCLSRFHIRLLICS